ncbi:hypothetical protein ACSVIJ_24190 [Pseudomonas sp. NCHU5208]|uniref:hypothetical protein n=1 Tax=unclassified Pseudomonas TaxID=196821 RepID=UPI003F955D16
MIESIETLLTHWGEQLAQNGQGVGLPSAMGTIVEFAGCAPRGGVYGAKLLVAGAGPDYAAAEVNQVLYVIERQEGGQLLGRLARVQYRNEPRLTIAEQVDVLELGRGETGRRAYYRQVGVLHERLQAGLLERQGKLTALRREARRADDRVRKAAVQQADAAHRGRGAELKRDRSSGDSAP